jgi:hypothetical protein
MDKVKALLEAGATLSEAVRSALAGRSLAQVALERGVNRSNLISALNGARTPTASEINALITEIGGDAQSWRQAFADAAHRRALAV